MKKHMNKTIILITFILSLFLFCNIAYSAIASTMNIAGTAYARVEADVRITKFSLLASENSAFSSYEEFTKDSITTGITLPSETSTLTYEIEVTNYSTADVAIESIYGIPSELTYSLENYTLKEKICDDTGKCNTLAKKNILITIKNQNQASYEGDISLTFTFKPVYNITYTNITNNNYPTSILAGETLQVDLSSNPPKLVGARYTSSTAPSTYQNNIITVDSVSDNIEIEGAYTTEFIYDYTEDYQTFTTPNTGTYKIELWGASGGSGILTGYSSDVANPIPGRGGYTSGNITLKRNLNLYIYVGGKGKAATTTTTIAAGGYNGGGTGAKGGNNNDAGGGGGGATDIRLTSGEWNSFNSLKSRIMVAAGGGGTNYVHTSKVTLYRDGLDAGGLAVSGNISTWESYWTPAVNQTTGGHFGYGSNGITNIQHGGAGGGGGYYGGYDKSINQFSGSSAGGSAFISGHEGCDAITSSSTESNITHTGQANHYSNYIFTDTIMIDGQGYKWTTDRQKSIIGMPTFDKTSTMTGNESNGYAKITLIEIN